MNLKQVIHCKNEEEWDIVRKTLDPECGLYNQTWEKTKHNYYPEGVAISLKDNTYCGLNYWKDQKDYEIISFEQWFKESESLVGRYIKALVDKPNSGYVLKGEIGLITKNESSIRADFPSQKEYCCSKGLIGTKYEILPKDFTLNNPQEDLLEIAKKKYPIGTKIYSALKNDNNPCQTTVKIYSLDVVNGRKVIWAGRKGFIYDDGKWAEIIKEETELNKWLKETKAKNLSLEQLTNYIDSTFACPYTEVFKKLKGDSAKSKAQILWNEWNEFWYLEWEDWLTEDLWNELVIKLNDIYGKQTRYLNWITFKDFKNNGYIRSKVGLRDDDHWCIDNNDQGLKIKKHLSDFITKPIENVTIKLPVNNIDFQEYKIYPEIPSNCFDVEKLNLQEKALTKPQLIQIKQLQTLN